MYVTRTYFTRHGDGPLPGEVEFHNLSIGIDKTNTKNDWQGNLRYAPMIPDLVSTMVWSDFRQSLKVADLILESGLKASLSLAITHVDEILPSEELLGITKNVLMFASEERTSSV